MPLDLNLAIDLACSLIKPNESCKLTSYPDPASPLGRQLRLPLEQRAEGWALLDGKPWTIGWGSTHGVTPNMTITQAEADYRLRVDLQEAINALKGKIGPVLDNLTSHQAGAMFDFVYNEGTGDPKKPEWTLWKIIRAEHYDQVPGELVTFVKAKGVKMLGLVRRRNAEVEMWSTNEPGSVEETPPSSVVRADPTPPVADDPVSAVKSGHLWTLGLGSVAAAPPAIKAAADQITQWVSPYADQTPMLHQVLNYCGIAAAGALIVGGGLAWIAKRHARN